MKLINNSLACGRVNLGDCKTLHRDLRITVEHILIPSVGCALYGHTCTGKFERHRVLRECESAYQHVDAASAVYSIRDLACRDHSYRGLGAVGLSEFKHVVTRVPVAQIQIWACIDLVVECHEQQCSAILSECEAHVISHVGENKVRE